MKDWTQSVATVFLTNVDVSCSSVAAYETVVAKLQSVMGLKDDGFSGAAVGKMDIIY